LFAPSFTFSVAVRVPVAAGLKTTLMVQADFAARLAPQVVVETVKSPGSAPVNEEPVMLSAVSRLFLSVIVWTPLVVPTFCGAKVMEVGETVVWAMPVPESVEVTVPEKPDDPPVTDRVADSAPRRLGVNFTVMVHADFAASELPQVSVCEKSFSFAPVKLILEMLSAKG
jgi:hypothetical protein